MNAKLPVCLQYLSTLGSTMASQFDLQAGSASLLQMMPAAIAVVAGAWCLGDRVFDHMHQHTEIDAEST